MARIKAHAQRYDESKGKMAHKAIKALKTSKKSKPTKTAAPAEPAKTSKSVESSKTTTEVAEVKKEKKPHRFRPGTVALREIRRLQKSTELLIPRASFIRVVRDAVQHVDNVHQYRMTADAFKILHEVAESVVVEIMEAAQTSAAANGRIQPKRVDMRLVMSMNPFWKNFMARSNPAIQHARSISRALREEHAVREYTRVYASVDPEKEALKKAQFEAERAKHALARQVKKAESAATTAKPADQPAESAEPAAAAVAEKPAAEAPKAAEAAAASEPAKPKKVKKVKTTINGKTNGVHHDVPVAAPAEETSGSAGGADDGFFSM
jgi:histone H3/H4